MDNGVRISELNAITQIEDNDILAGVETSDRETKKVEMQTLKSYVNLDNGSELSVTLNPNNYQLTFELLNYEGSVLSTSIIDLPIESLVKDVRYDAGAKEIVFVLESGKEVRVNISDIVSGLVSETQMQEYVTTEINKIKGKVVEIGSYQYNYNGTILPAIPVTLARQIYDDDRKGIPVIVHWSLYGTENNLKVVSSDYIAGTYSIDVLVHNKFHCEYSWTNDTTGNINPNVDETVKDLRDEFLTDQARQDEELKALLEGLPQKTATGTDSLYYEDGQKASVREFTAKGNVYQETTSGKSIVNFNEDKTRTVYGITFTYALKNGLLEYIDLNGTATNDIYHSVKSGITLQAGTYKSYNGLGGSQNGAQMYLQVNGEWDSDDKKLFTLESEQTISENIYISKGSTLNHQRYYPMITLGNNTDDTYEPYCGGTASPNPDYQQEVQTLKGYNLANIDDIVIGKQWTGKTSDPLRASILNIPVKSNEVHTLSGDISSNDHLTELRVVTFGELGAITHTGVFEGTFTVPSNANYLSIEILADTTITKEMLQGVWIQLNEGTQKPYLPYNSIGVRRIGKNRLNITTFTDGTRVKTTNGITATINDDKSITLKGTATAQTYFYLLKNDFDLNNGNDYFWCNSPSVNCRFEFVCAVDGVTKYLNSYGTPNTFSKNNSFVYSGSNINIANGTTVDVTLKPMVANGIFKDYEPYQERIDYIDLKGNKLFPEDTLYYDKGHIWLKKNWYKYQFTGNEDIITTPYNGKYYHSFNMPVKGKGETYKCYSTHYTYSQAYANNTIRVGTWTCIFRDDYNATDVINYLKENKPIVYYPLAEPQEIDLGEYDIKSLRGINNVTVEAELPATYMEETYINDINKELEQIKNALLILGGGE